MPTAATDLLRRDHRRIERILARFELELGNPQGEGLETLARTFAEIRAELEQHFRREEDVFYAAFLETASQTGFDTSQLRQEHSDVQHVIAALEPLLEARSDSGSPAPSVRAEISTLGWELWNHIHHHMAQEETGLFSFADSILDAKTQNRLAREMEAQSR